MHHVSAHKPLELWCAIWEDVMSPEHESDVPISREELLPTVFQLGLTDAALVVQYVRVRGRCELQVELVDVRQKVVKVEVAGERENGSVGQGPQAFEIEVAPRRILWVCDAVLDGIYERRRAALEVLIRPVGFQERAFIQCEMSPGSEIQDAGAMGSEQLVMSKLVMGNSHLPSAIPGYSNGIQSYRVKSWRSIFPPSWPWMLNSRMWKSISEKAQAPSIPRRGTILARPNANEQALSTISHTEHVNRAARQKGQFRRRSYDGYPRRLDCEEDSCP